MKRQNGVRVCLHEKHAFIFKLAEITSMSIRNGADSMENPKNPVV